MADATIEEIHSDIETIKRDVAEIKEVLLGDEGELSDYAKERIERYLKEGTKKVVSQG